MRVLVHSDSQRAIPCFRRIERGNDYELEIHPSREYRKNLRNSPPPLVIYLDIQGFTPAEVTRAVRYLAAKDGVLVGLIDPKESVDDVAELFHQGLFDYIGRSLWREGLTLKRFRKAVDAFSGRLYTDDNDAEPTSPVVAIDNWQKVSTGKEYTFCFMFLELDLNEDWRSKSGREHLDRVTYSLESHVQRTVAPMGGRIWMWSDYGGVVLFPFDGKSCDAVLACYRLVLNRTIISAEDFDFDTLLSYRIALHIGNTIYRPRGKTGTIISDAVNFVFHLGHQYAKPGGFYLTSTVYPFIPKGLESSFIDCRMYEGQHIYRMRRRES